jgi:hypothetical protein
LTLITNDCKAILRAFVKKHTELQASSELDIDEDIEDELEEAYFVSPAT